MYVCVCVCEYKTLKAKFANPKTRYEVNPMGTLYYTKYLESRLVEISICVCVCVSQVNEMAPHRTYIEFRSILSAFACLAFAQYIFRMRCFEDEFFKNSLRAVHSFVSCFFFFLFLIREPSQDKESTAISLRSAKTVVQLPSTYKVKAFNNNKRIYE